MKLFFTVLFLLIGGSIFTQSKKEQIAQLNYRIDSLNNEYIKDSTRLRNELILLDEHYNQTQTKIILKKSTLEQASKKIENNLGLIIDINSAIDSLIKKNQALKTLSLLKYIPIISENTLPPKCDDLIDISNVVDQSIIITCDNLQGIPAQYDQGRVIIPKGYTGSVIASYGDGYIHKLYNYKNGVQHGLFRKWSSYTGQLEGESIYRDGEEYFRIDYDRESGKFLRASLMRNGSVSIVSNMYGKLPLNFLFNNPYEEVKEWQKGL